MKLLDRCLLVVAVSSAAVLILARKAHALPGAPWDFILWWIRR